MLAGALPAAVRAGAAAPTWTIVPSAQPAGAPIGGPRAISCTSPTACLAVGAVFPQHSMPPQKWNGSDWVSVAPPSLQGTQLVSLSCPIATSCFGVGSQVVNGDYRTLIERWDGAALAAVSSPNVAARDNRLLSVSCVSTTSCFAVGYSSRRNFIDALTLIEHWDGNAWTIVASPDPTPPTAELHGVSCSSDTNCFAVGLRDGTSGEGQLTFAERWNGTTWSIVPTPNDSHAIYSVLEGVSCPSAGSCFAAGWYQAKNTLAAHSVIERWNGTSWSLVASPIPKDSTRTLLSSVSCASDTRCFAAGYAITDVDQVTIHDAPLIDVWDGTSWSVATTPALGTGEALLYDISCATSSSCFAIGYQLSGAVRALFERWNGTSWSLAEPSGSSTTQVLGITCRNTTACVAVGTTTNVASVASAMVQRGNGSSWRGEATPSSNTGRRTLASVSCPAPTSCFAVGSTYGPKGLPRMLIEHWNGATWSVMTNPTITGNPSTSLTSISCVTISRCIAVGTGHDGNGLIIKWSGTIWRILSAPTPSGPLRYTHFTGVSCVSGSNCFAVGYRGYLGSGRSAIEHFDGTAWSIEKSGLVGAAFLNAVSCPTATFCLAVGYSTSMVDRKHVSSTFMLRFDGKGWSKLASPNVDRFNTLLGVSCPTATTCVAVGQAGPKDKNTTLIETWNKGAPPAITPSPNLADSVSNTLAGVSCASATTCFAVGTAVTTTSSYSLIERLG